ncbi:amidohydrolase family protein [Sporichthya brevicatena]|uniref:Amidohydrolase family protein n=1 Tax=Sporichthya brevicatena TaxID=171442 RepID=A0ABN1GQF9_9ACTN
MTSRPVLDAWVQPWTPAVAQAQPARNRSLAERLGATRLLEGMPAEALLEEMDAAGVDRALVSAGPTIAWEEVLKAVALAPERLLPVASVDPWGLDGVMPAVHELRRAVEEDGAVALKLEPFHQDKALTEARWYPLYATCVDLDITLQVQVGNTGPATYPSYTGQPLYIDRLAIDFPELRIVAGHIGWPWTTEMIAIAQKHDNVWIDTSAHQPKYYPPEFVHFLRTFGRTKCIWASDWPILDFPTALAGIDAFELKPEVERRFLHDNAVAAFRLDRRGWA